MNKSIVLLMRFEDYLTSSTTVIIEKRRSPEIVTIFWKVLFYYMIIACLLDSKASFFISKLSVPGILLSGIFMMSFDLRSIEKG